MKKVFITLLLLVGLLILPSSILAAENVAKIGEQGYATLGAAIEAVTDGETITLLDDIEVETILIDGKDVTINLNGFDIVAYKKVFEIKDATVRFEGSGKVVNQPSALVNKPGTRDTSVIELIGSAVETDVNYTNLYIGPSVTLEGRVGVIVYPVTGTKVAYGITMEFDGKINAINDAIGETTYGGVGVQINGTIQHTTNAPIIKFNKGSKIDSTDFGIYAAGYATWTFNEMTVNAVDSGLGIKSGKFNVNDCSIKTTGEDTTPTTGWSNGMNSSGAVFQLESNKSYKGEVELTVNKGTYESENGFVFYEYLANGTAETKVKSVEILDGTFISGTDKAIVLTSEKFPSKVKEFIKGGLYSYDPSVHVAPGYKAVVDINKYLYKVSKVTTPVETGTKSISGTISGVAVGMPITVQLKSGGVVVKSVLADINNNYEFTNVAAGTYNVVVIVGIKVNTRYVELRDSNVDLDITFNETLTTNIVVYEETTPNIAVKGLDEVSDNQPVDLLLGVVPTSEITTESNAIKAIATGKSLTYLVIEVLVDNESIGELEDTVLEFAISYDLSKYKNVVIYRYHAETAEKFTKLETRPSADYEDGTYYLDTTNNVIYVYASQFSVYAIGNDPIDNPDTSDNIIPYVIVGAITLIGITTIVAKKKKYN